MGPRFIFPPFSFDREERVLRRDGRTVPLAPKVAEALGLLLAEPGALVEKNVLRTTLWPDGFVEDGNLTQTIYLIRRALDPDGDGRGFVETIPRRGYRFVRPVELVAGVEPGRRPLASLAFALRAVAAAVVIAFAFGGVSVGYVAPHPAAQLEGEAGRAYALGWYTWNRRTADGARAGIAHFNRVIALAPNDPRGYAGLAAVYAEIGDWDFTALAKAPAAYARAERYAHEALRRDPHSGEALGVLGLIALQRDFDLDRAETELRTAILYKPDYAPAYESLGIMRLERGDAAGAQTLLARSIELDPLSPMDLVWYGKSLYYAQRFREARAALRQLADLEVVDNHGAAEVLALADIELGLRTEARAAIAKLRAVGPQKADYSAMLEALLDVRGGRPVGALPNLRPRQTTRVDTATASAVCLALGRRDDALAWLAIGLRDKHGQRERALIAIDPRLVALHGDKRFQALIARSG